MTVLKIKKYCEDCKFSKVDHLGGYQFARCINSKARSNYFDTLVSRDIPLEFNYCSTMRQSDECGEEALLFEPKLENARSES